MFLKNKNFFQKKRKKCNKFNKYLIVRHLSIISICHMHAYCRCQKRVVDPAERFPSPLDLFDTSVWKRAQRKTLEHEEKLLAEDWLMAGKGGAL